MLSSERWHVYTCGQHIGHVEVHDPWTRCERGCTFCNRRVALLGANADFSGLWSRDQMASALKRDGPLNDSLKRNEGQSWESRVDGVRVVQPR